MELRTFVSLNIDGKEVCRYDITGNTGTVSPSSPARANDAPDLPITLDWYRDTAKWLVTGAAATLTLGLGYFAETTESWQRWAFTTAGLVLLIALGAGALLQHWVVEFGKLWETRALINPSKAAELEENDRARENYARHSRLAYLILLTAFFGGMVAFSVTCGIRMWTSRSKQTFAMAVKKSEEDLVLLDPATGEVWRVAPGTEAAAKAWTLSVSPPVHREKR
jgi:hypothetical protein